MQLTPGDRDKAALSFVAEIAPKTPSCEPVPPMAASRKRKRAASVQLLQKFINLRIGACRLEQCVEPA